MSKVTERIDLVLKERGISKQAFYQDCELTSSAYSQWNTGKTEPRAATLRRVADYLDLNYEWLVSGIGTKEKAPTPEGERDFAQNEHEEDMLLLARHMGPIPDEDRQALKEQFRSSIDLYLKAKGFLPTED